MNDTESPSMIWRHIMLALPEVESLSSHVLDRVGRLARGLQAELEIFHCLYDPQLVRSGVSELPLAARIQRRVEDSHRRLERVADSLRDQGVEVRASVRFDYPIFEAVVREVLRQGPNLLIVPTAQVGHAGPIALSYTHARLIEACPCPLLLLKTEEVYSKGPIIAAIDPKHAREKPAELDDTIVAAAKTLSSALSDAPVLIYHAVPSLGELVAGAANGETVRVPAEATQQRAYFAECESEARKVAARHEVPLGFVHVEAGTVESTLPLCARDARADAVVMGAVSRSYPERAFLGYTAERVLGALRCDVLIVKPQGFRCPVSRRPHRVSKQHAEGRQAPARTP